MAEQHAGHPRHGHPRDLVPGRGQRHLVPDRRQRLRQVRVAAEERAAAVDLGPVHRPGVAVGILVNLVGGQLAELVEQLPGGLGDRLRHRPRVARASRRRWPGGRRHRGRRRRLPGRGAAGDVRGDRREWFLQVGAGVVGSPGVRGDGGEPGAGVRRAERALQDRVVERAGRVVELLGQHPLDDQAVDRGPRPGVGTGQREHRRPVAGGTDLRDVVVHALGVGEQRLPGRAGGLRPLVLRRPQQSQPQLELIAGEVGGAAELGELAFAETALEVHLRQPVLRLHVAKGQEQIVVVAGVDRGQPVLGERDRDRLGQPGDVQRLRGDRRAVVGRRPRPASRVEGGPEGRDRSVAEAEDAEQESGHDDRADSAEHEARPSPSFWRAHPCRLTLR